MAGDAVCSGEKCDSSERENDVVGTEYDYYPVSARDEKSVPDIVNGKRARQCPQYHDKPATELSSDAHFT